MKRNVSSRVETLNEIRSFENISMNLNNDRILIIDSGSQFCKLIDRAVRELQIETRVSSLSVSSEEVLNQGYKGIIISGGPFSVNDPKTDSFDYNIFKLGIPILAICYGMQMLVKYYGGVVEKLESREDCQCQITIHDPCRLYKNMDKDQIVLLTHGDTCTTIPSQFKINCFSSSRVVVGISDETLQIYGVQFHPEVNLTMNGRQIFSNFLFDICNCSPSFIISDRVNSCIEKIKKDAGEDKKVIMLVSGGVDSTVTAALIHKALGKDRVYCFLIDHGFMRVNEALLVKQYLEKAGIPLRVINAKFSFLNGTTNISSVNASNVTVFHEIGPLSAVTNPELKRHIIGDVFMQVVESAVSTLNLNFKDCILGQGTLRPDLIESACPDASQSANVIKTHHNDTGLVRSLRAAGRILEPLKDFHKDEVRKIGLQLNLPASIVKRYPFPGPGLAIRILNAVDPYICLYDSKFDVAGLAKFIANFHQNYTKEPHPVVKMLQTALSSTDIESLLKATANLNLNATLLPIRSVGIQGDSRSYKNVIALSSDEKIHNWEDLFIIAKIIPQICTSINRVVYTFGNMIKRAISHVTCTFLTPQVIEFAATADHIVSNIIENYRDNVNINQFPVIIIPIQFDTPQPELFPPLQRSVVLRPFVSEDFMTGLAAVPGKDIPLDVLNLIVESLVKMPQLSRVLYDLTSKPPGTTEWE